MKTTQARRPETTCADTAVTAAAACGLPLGPTPRSITVGDFNQLPERMKSMN